MNKFEGEVRHMAEHMHQALGDTYQELSPVVVRNQCCVAAMMLFYGLDAAYIAKQSGAINEPTILYSVDMV